MESSSRCFSFLVMLVLLATSVARAEEMVFAEEELPTEAVTPRLDTPKAVLSRKLSYEKRWQADLQGGWLLDEPFYKNQYLAVQATYSWSEASGVGVKYMAFGGGISDYSKQFYNSSSSSPNGAVDFEQAKGPSSGWLAFYERRMMYGKVSVSKHKVMPALLTWGVEAGMMKYGTKQLPLAGGSVGNRFFLGDHFGLALGLHAYFRQLVDPLSANLRTTQTESDFSTTTKLSMALDLSLIYLF
ncbi:MAG: hypothetical protein ACAH59_05000 [Pseudobdellovibrionaceae bacterium]